MGLMSLGWLWIVIAIGVVFYLFRRNSGANAARLGNDSRNLLDGRRDSGHDGRAERSVQTSSGSNANAPEAAIDPVSGDPVSTARALTSFHQGRVYYFANKENRDRFEASPEEYAQKVAGHSVPGTDTQHEHEH
jgi:YHS domain-containing protein